MVSKAREDRDVLQFLWVDNITNEQPELLTLCFTRVGFGVSSSPFLLNATIWHHLESHLATQPYLRQKLLRSFYVDDIVTEASDEDHAYMLYQASKNVLKEGGFNWRKFGPNSGKLQMRIDRQESSDLQAASAMKSQEMEETYVSATLGSSHEQHFGERKVLGVRWDIASDDFVMSLEDIASVAAKLKPTRRTIVSLVGSVQASQALTRKEAGLQGC